MGGEMGTITSLAEFTLFGNIFLGNVGKRYEGSERYPFFLLAFPVVYVKKKGIE